MITSPPFIHLRVHSAYSLAEGALKIPTIVALCKKYTMPAVAITDTCNLFGALEASIACMEKGVQLIVGCTLRVRRPQPNPYTPAVDDMLVLLVQTEQGYQNLLYIVSQAYLSVPSGETPHVPWSMVKEHAEGLIALTAGVDGIVGKLLLDNKTAEAEQALKELHEVFVDRLYVEIGRHGWAHETKIEPQLVNMADQRHIPLVATNTAFFEDEEMYEAHDALLCVAEGSYVNQNERRRVTPHHSFKSAEAMAKLFQDLPDAVANTAVIAQRCQYMPTPQKPILPAFPTENGRTEADELRAQAEAGLAGHLTRQVYTVDMSAAEKAQIAQTYQERLNYEIDIIEKMGFPGYFLIVSDFIKWAKANNIPVGPGRGSGAGSLVAWSLLITDLDPIRFGLLFERFLNPERVSMPDFDVDFCQDRRDEVIAYVCQKYGSDRVAHIITFGKLQARAVLRDVGRVLQMPYPQVDRICKMVPNNPTSPVTLQEAIDQEPMLQQMIRDESMVAKLVDIALKLEGLYRHASTHAAGVVIGDRPLTQLVPLYKDERSLLPATQFSMKYVEQAGLLKFDFLGLKTLTVLQCTVNLLKEQDIHINLSEIPLDDPATFALLQRVETVGIFQLESSGMRDVVRKMVPDRFEEIIALVALYRPGPMDDIPRYIACKHGLEPVTYAHPTLEPILKDSFGVMVYQEQVMKIAQELAGYSLGGADLLRRAMGKKIKAEMDAQRQMFVEGAMGNGIQQGVANQIFDQVAKFAGYGFNKSHAAPYALISYQTAYMKANHPVAFFAATMTYDMHNTDKLNVYQQELKRLKIPLLPPDVNVSGVRFTVETFEGQQCVRYALAAIKGVGEGAMASLVAEREKNGPFKNLTDFCQRLNHRVVNKRQLEGLIAAGALDSLEPNRRRLFEHVDMLLKYSGGAEANQDSLFSAIAPVTLDLPEIPDWGPLERLQQEFGAVGFYLSAHPLEAYASLLSNHHIDTWSEVVESSTKDTAKLAGVILAKQERTSKQGSRFAFLQVSDMTGVFEITLFSETLQRLKMENPTCLEPGELIVTRVQIRREEDTIRCTVSDLYLLASMVHQSAGTYTVLMASDASTPAVMQRLSTILAAAGSGKSALSLCLQMPDKVQVDIKLPTQYNINQTTYFQLKAVPGVIEVTQI